VSKDKEAAKASQQPERAKLSPKESLERMLSFTERKEQFVAAIRKGKDRSESA